MDQFASASWDDLVNDRVISRRRKGRQAKSELKKRIARLKAETQCREFPTNVVSLAKAVGIRDVRCTALAMRGRLVHDTSGIVAEINETLSMRTQRFVLAHEITHMLIARDLATKGALAIYGSDREKSRYDQVEALCDFGAREILLPENAVMQHLKSVALSLRTLVSIAEEAACEVDIVAETISDLPGQWSDLLFLFCEIKQDTVEVMKAIPNLGMTFEVADDQMGLLRAALESTDGVRGAQEIWANFTRRSVTAEALAVGANIVVLLINRYTLE